MDTLACLEGVGVSLGGSPVLRELDLIVSAGEIVGISGPNGSGKTTLIRALATLQATDGGSGTILGEKLGSPAVRRVRQRIGLIGHAPGLISELSLRENLIHISKLAGIDPNRVDHSLEVVGLQGAADRRVSAASYGMKRRVEAAHLLLRRPDLLLLDEAMSGLDSNGADLIRAIVESTVAEGGAAVVVSHDVDHLSRLAQRTLHLEAGKLRAGE